MKGWLKRRLLLVVPPSVLAALGWLPLVGTAEGSSGAQAAELHQLHPSGGDLRLRAPPTRGTPPIDQRPLGPTGPDRIRPAARDRVLGAMLRGGIVKRVVRVGDQLPGGWAELRRSAAGRALGRHELERRGSGHVQRHHGLAPLRPPAAG